MMKLAQPRDCKILGVALLTTLQMSVRDVMLAGTQEDATLLVECARTLKGQIKFPCAWYAKAIASRMQLTNICLETAFPFYCHS